jgi:hypothetical protein
VTVRIKQWVLSIAVAFPLLWLALVYLYILRVRVHLGHWPSASDGMAKYMAFALVHHDLTVDILLILPLILVAVIVSAFLCRRHNSHFRAWIPITILVGSILLGIVVSVADPGGFILWFVD